MLKKYCFFAFAVLFILLPTACQAMEPASVDPPPVMDTGYEYAEEILQGLNSSDYDQFSDHLNSTMLDAIQETDFEQLSQSISSALGTYSAVSFLNIEEQDGLIVLYYLCSFEKGDMVMKLVLEPEPPNLISGLWFPDFNP